MERLLSIPAAADRLSMSESTVRRLIRVGKLGAVRVPGSGDSRRLRVPESALVEFIEAAKEAA